MPRTHKRAFSRPNGISFISHLADDALMTGAAIPTPSIIESANKTVKIGDSCKIIHSKHCRIDKFNNVYEEKMLYNYCCLWFFTILLTNYVHVATINL